MIHPVKGCDIQRFFRRVDVFPNRSKCNNIQTRNILRKDTIFCASGAVFVSERNMINTFKCMGQNIFQLRIRILFPAWVSI